MTRSHLPFLPPARRAPRPALALATLLAVVLPALAGVNSARYRFEGNKRLSLDLSVDDVRAEENKFEWPATLLRFKSGYKGTVKVANGSSRQAAVGIGVAVYGQAGKRVGAETTGSTMVTTSLHAAAPQAPGARAIPIQGQAPSRAPMLR